MAAAVGLLALAIWLFLSPLFRWQTGFVVFGIDSYPQFAVDVVPFFDEDLAGLADSLSPILNSRLGTKPLRLTGFESADAVRTILPGRMQQLPLRAKDVLVAYVRGQSLVAPPLSDIGGGASLPGDPLGGAACLLATDFSIRGERPQGIVRWREVLESIGASPAMTTLMAIDLGDLEWDPRLGVLANVVARQLDEDLSAPQRLATDQNWIIGSQDLFGISRASFSARRTLFARALELGLGGHADAAPWGDADAIVEMDELARFMSVQIGEWSLALTGGRFQQRPVVWKLGQGRVALADIPEGIELVRVPGPRSALLERLKGQPANAKKLPARVSPPVGGATGEDGGKVENGDRRSNDDALRSAAWNTDQTAAPIRLVSGEPTPASPAKASVMPDVARANQTPPPSGAATPLPVDQGPAPLTPALETPGALPTADSSASPAVDRAAPDGGEKPDPDGTSKANGSNPDPADTFALDIDRIAARRNPPNAPAPRLLPVDFSPHTWNRLMRVGFAADVRARTNLPRSNMASGRASVEQAESDMTPNPAVRDEAQSPRWLRARKFLMEISQDVHRMTTGSDSAPFVSGLAVVNNLRDARSVATQASLFRAWDEAPQPLRKAVAIRNDAVETVLAAVEFIGRYSGGAGPPVIDPMECRVLAEQALELGRTISNMTPDSRSDQRSMQLRLASLSELCSTQTAWLRELAVRPVFPAVKPGGASRDSPLAADSVDLRQWRAAMESTLLAGSQRRILPEESRQLDDLAGREDHRAEAPGLAGQFTLEVVRQAWLPFDSPPQIDRQSLRSIGLLVEAFAAGCDAAGIDSASPTGVPQEVAATADDIRLLRKEAGALASAVSNDRTAIAAIVRLGGRCAKLLSGVVASLSRAPGGESTILESDRIAALLRIIDYRDVPALPRIIVAAPPLAQQRKKPAIALRASDAALLTRGAPLSVSLQLPELGEGVSYDTNLRLHYDPAEVEVRLEGGPIVEPDRPLPLRGLPIRGRVLELRVEAVGFNRTAAPWKSTRLTAIAETDEDYLQAELDLKLPERRDIVWAARRTPLAAPRFSLDKRPTVGVGADGWDFSTDLSYENAPSGVTASMLILSALPDQATAWEFGVVNTAKFARQVSLNVYSLPAAKPGETREDVWRTFSSAVVADRWHGSPLATIPTMALENADRITPVVFPPPTPAAAPLPAPSGSTAASGVPPPVAPAEEPLSPDLAVVIRELTPDQPPLISLTRLILSAEHPRHRVAVNAVWRARERSIVVTVKPVAFEAPASTHETAKPHVARLSLEPLKDAPSLRKQPLAIRKGTAFLGLGHDSDTMVAIWNGNAQDGRAWLEVKVDGYPRAFVFSVDCSPAADGEIQMPQSDWRSVHITKPLEKEIVQMAPAKALPFNMAIDLPADAVGEGVRNAGEVTLSLRAVSDADFQSETPHSVWTSTEDRQALFTRGKAEAPATFAVKTKVQDWEIDASGLGFENVDVVAEVNVRVPGSQQALLDRRLFVMDARAPVVEAPPSMTVVVGRPLVVPVRVTDDPREFAGGPHLAGVSGVARVEWGLDLKGVGKPADWQPAINLGDGTYEVRVDTAKLPLGDRFPLFIRAVDRAGLENTPEPVWLESAPVVAKNSIQGRVLLEGLGEDGVSVWLDGPGERKAATSKAGGAFEFVELEPGDYTLQASGPVRNRAYRSEALKVSVQSPPAPAASVTLQLK